AFCAHVADEALTGFLPIYNATVLAMRSQYNWFPMPTFEFREWLTGLIVANIVLLLLTPLAFRNAQWLRPLASVHAGVHLLIGTSADLRAQEKPEGPLRVALAGLVHGHAFGFFDQFQRRTDMQVVGIAEADPQLRGQFAKRFGLQPGIFFSDLEEMLKKTHPQAVLAYTNTYDHRRVVEICARHGVPVMME